MKYDEIIVGKEYKLTVKKRFMAWDADDNEMMIQANAGDTVKVIGKSICTCSYLNQKDWAFLVVQFWSKYLDDCGESLIGSSFIEEINK